MKNIISHTSSIRIKNIFVLILALSFAMSILFFGLSGGALAETSQNSVVDGTLLESGQGLILGENYIRSTANSGVDVVYSSDSVDSTNRFGDDIYFDPVSVSSFSSTSSDGTPNTVGLEKDGFYLNYYTGSTDDTQWASAPNFSFKSKIKLSDNTLSSALSQSRGTVLLTITFDYQVYNASSPVGQENVIDYQDYFDFSALWSPDGSVDNVVSHQESKISIDSDKKTYSVTLTLNKTNFDYSKAYLDLTFTGFKTDGADMVTVGTDSRPSTGIFVRFSNVVVTGGTRAEGYTLSFSSESAKVEETRSVLVRSDQGVIYSDSSKESIYFENQPADFQVSTSPLYVKYGDKLYLYSDVAITEDGVSKRMDIPEDYSSSVNSTDKPITWVLPDGETKNYDWLTTLLNDENPTGTPMQRAGRTAVYNVKYSDQEEKSLTLVPRIIYSYEHTSGGDIYNYVTGKEMTVYFDNTRPVAPSVSLDSPLAKYGYDESLYGVISEQNVAKRYTSSLQLQFSLTNLSDIFTTEGTSRAPEAVYYTIDEDESPTDASSNRKKADFSGSTATITFEKAGFYTVRLATIDAAGNYSDVVTYRIVVDNTDYLVTTSFYGGLSTTAMASPLNSSTIKKIASVTMSSSSNSPDTLVSKTSGMYKRGTTIKIRVEMTETQYKNYQLVSIFNGATGDSTLRFDDVCTTPVFDSATKRYVYEISVPVDMYVEPDLNDDGNIRAFTLSIGDKTYEMYDGQVTLDGLSAGTFSYSTSILKIGTTEYYVITDGLEKGIYSMTASDDGTTVIDGTKYAITPIPDSVLEIKGRTIDLLSSSNVTARNFYFVYKQRLNVSVTGNITTFKYEKPTATLNAVAISQGINIVVPSDFTALDGAKETFSGISYDIRYYSLTDTSVYSSITDLLSKTTVKDAYSQGFLTLLTDSSGTCIEPYNAGEYLYTATISEDSTFYQDYYFDLQGSFIINKADAGVVFDSLTAFGFLDENGNLVQKTLEYASGGMKTMDEYIIGLSVDGGYSQEITSIGVQGKYSIATDTVDYTNPLATKGSGMQVEVVFTPSETNNYSGGKYAVLNAQNIQVKRMQVYLIVSKRNVVIDLNESDLTTTYSGASVDPQVEVKLHDDLGFVPSSQISSSAGATTVLPSGLVLDTSGFTVYYEYRKAGSDDDFGSISSPVNVGKYDIKIIVEGDNFYGTYILSENDRVFSIEKKNLTVFANFQSSYEYTYYELPSSKDLYAYYYVDTETGSRPITQAVKFDVSYEYGKVEGTYESLDTADFNAGFYRATITVNDANFSGSTTATFKINKVTKTTSGLIINAPTVAERDGSYARYGEMLQDILITTGNGVNVKYTKKNGDVLTVGNSSSFVIANRQNLVDSTKDDYDYYGIEATAKYFTDTVFDEVTSLKTIDILFIPTDLVNFSPFTVTLSLAVDKAIPLYDGDTDETDNYNAYFEPITYGTQYKNAVFHSGGKTASPSTKINAPLFYYYGGVKTAIDGVLSGTVAGMTMFPSGQQFLTYMFTPKDTTRFESLDAVNLTLNVEKKTLNISYQDGDRITVPYGEIPDIYGKLTNDGTSKEEQAVAYEWILSQDSTFDQVIEYSNTLSVGTYYIKISIVAENYQGEKVLPFEIVKATPKVELLPSIEEFEWNMPLSTLDGATGLLNRLNYVIKNPSTDQAIQGTFSVVYGDLDSTKTFETEFRENGVFNTDIQILFTPSLEYIDNYSTLNIPYSLTVNKVTVEGSDYIFENTSATFDGDSHLPTAYLLIDGVKTSYSDKITYSVSPINQGKYSLVATISSSDELYRGNTMVEYEILPLTAEEITLQVKDEYILSDGSFGVGYQDQEIEIGNIFDLSSSLLKSSVDFTYTLKITNYANQIATVKNMGKYTVKLSFYGNFQGEKTFEFVVKESSVKYQETDTQIVYKTYSPDSKLTGQIRTPEIVPSMAVGVVKYAVISDGKVGEYTTTVPYLAGTYSVKTFFIGSENNGYEGSDDGIILVIEKRSTTITATRLTDPTYTGQAIRGEDMLGSAFSLNSSDKGTFQYTYSYSVDGETFTEEPYKDAGDYFLKISLKDDNFQGEIIYKYTVKKADLTYKGSFDTDYILKTNSIVYSTYSETDSDNSYFVRTDVFMFNGLDIDGTFLFDGRESIKSLYVGEYTIGFTFTPENGNLNTYNGSVKLSVEKRDLTEYLTFDTKTSIYDGTQKEASLRFLTSEELSSKTLTSLNLTKSAEKTILSSIVVYYDGSTTMPTNAGTISLSGSLSHDNYTATITGQMTIDKATPEITAPLNIATASTTYNAYATIKDTQSIVEGTFLSDGTTDGVLKVRFTPTDTQNLQSTVFYILVGSSVSASSVNTYGMTLGDSKITLDGVETTKITWSDATEIVRFGSHSYDAIYTENGTSRKVALQVVLEDQNHENYLSSFGDIYLIVESGKTFADGMILGEDGQKLDFTVKSISLAYPLDTVVLDSMFSSQSIDNMYATVSYTFNSATYETVIPLRLNISSDNFKFTIDKAYAGQKLTADDLFGKSYSKIKVSVTGASVSPDMILTIFDQNGTDITQVGIESVGTYTLQFVIDKKTSLYSGSCLTTFEVSPQDLSQYIEVGGGKDLTKVYGSAYSITAKLTGDYADLNDEIEFLYYYKESTASEYSMYNIPSSAGNYLVKVVISGSDIYGGEVVKEYVIEKKTVTITLSGRQVLENGDIVVNRSYGSVTVPQLSISDGVKDYTLTYEKDGEILTITPENAGEYRVNVQVDEDNYQGQGSFTLRIAKLTPILSTLPTISPITYGTSLTYATISDFTSDVEGKITLREDYKDSILPVGNNDVILVFTPSNSNYETIEIVANVTVARVTPKFRFNVTEVTYTGQEIALNYTTDSFVKAEDIVFYSFDGNMLSSTIKDAGTYYVRVVIGTESGNYYYTNVAEENLGNSALYQKIIVKKSTAKGEVSGKEPSAQDVSYGEKLAASEIDGSVMLYDNGQGGTIEISGTFAFVVGESMLYTVGDNQEFDVIFTPTDKNYEEYRFLLPVNVKKKTVTISVTDGNTIVYGEKIKALEDFTFSIEGHQDLTEKGTDGKYKYISLATGSILDTLLESGKYPVKVSLDDTNYEGSFEFILTVEKRAVDLSFYKDKALTTEVYGDLGYTFTFGDTASIYAGLSESYKTGALLDFIALTGKTEQEISSHIASKLLFTYTSKDGHTAYDSLNSVLKTAGEYKVVVEILSSSSFRGSHEAIIVVNKYEIGRADISFDSLNSQIYGSVTAPVVTLYDKANPDKRLTGVSYYITWGDSTVMPTSAGRHNGKLVVNDDNYERYEKTFVMTVNQKKLEIKNLKIANKDVDGTPWLNATASIEGVLIGDEVGLQIEAYTLDKETYAGEHEVVISKCSLYGLDSGNYYVETPQYTSKVTIYSKKVVAETGDSYVVYSIAKGDDIKFDAAEIDSAYNKSNFVSMLTGQSATVMAFNIRKDGYKMALDSPVQVYIKIPDKYLKRADLKVEGLGALADADINFQREGDYITFTTNVSGEIVFSTTTFPYGIILISAGVLVLVIGFLAIAFIDPSKKKVGFSGLHRVTKVDSAYEKYYKQKRKAESKPPKTKKKK